MGLKIGEKHERKKAFAAKLAEKAAAETETKPEIKPKTSGWIKKGDKWSEEALRKRAETYANQRKQLVVLDAIKEAMFDTTVSANGQTLPVYLAFIKKFVGEAMREKDSYAEKTVAGLFFTPDVISKLDETYEKTLSKDIDFLHYRLHKRLFDLQRAVLFDNSKKKIMICGRRSGKTECDAALIVDAAVAPNSLILYIGQTFTDAMTMIAEKIKRFASAIDIPVSKFDRTEGVMTLANGSQIFLRGNASAKEREKLQGKFYDLIVIDEIQSQQSARYLIETICEPMLVDRGGSLVLSGSPPRVPNTYAERVFKGEVPGFSTYNWNLSKNPFIANYQTVLEEIKAEKHLSDTDTVYQREYLGKFVYDTEAIVFKPTAENWFESAESWLDGRFSVKLFGGIDYGFEDATALAIVAVDADAREMALIYEDKKRHQGVSDIVAMMKKACDFAAALPINEDAKRAWYWHADTSAQNVSFELATIHGFRVADAYKADKSFAIDELRDWVREGRLKFAQNGHFADECRQIVFKRDPVSDLIIHEIDDDVYHPDVMDALLYASRVALYEIGGFGNAPSENKY